MSLSPERECLIITEMQARDAALAALGRWRAGDVSSVRLYAGPGHSGACAAACARHLLNYGVPCLLYVAGGRPGVFSPAARGLGETEWSHDGSAECG